MTGLTRATALPRSRAVDPTALLTALWLGALVVATWPVAAAAAPLALLPLAVHVCAVLAGYGVLVLLVVIARSFALERGVGADVLTRCHAHCGRAVIGLAHAGAAIAAWAQARRESLAAGTWEVLGMPLLPSATVCTLLMVAAAVVSVPTARRRLRFERWHAVHLLMYVAIALSFGHMLAGPDLVGHLWLQVGRALAYTHAFVLVLRHRVLAPLRQAARHRLRVTEVRPEGPGVVSIHVAGQHLPELQAEPGQFFRWRFLTPDHRLTAHPFSLSAAPTATTLRLTVKPSATAPAGYSAHPSGPGQSPRAPMAR